MSQPFLEINQNIFILVQKNTLKLIQGKVEGVSQQISRENGHGATVETLTLVQL